MSLWGGFADPSDNSLDSALEKRLELDFNRSVRPVADFTITELEQVMAAAGEELDSHTVEQEMLAVTFQQSLLVLSPRKLVVTAASSVMLHRVLPPMLTLLAAREVTVEWAAFFRKNTTAPWSATNETSDIMAQEYADLKAAFPRGQSFLTGPVDGDHFFHFVYDSIDRTTPEARTEDDVQVNVFLYDVVETVEGDETGAPRKERQQLQTLPNSEYEMLRVFAAAPCVSFETNAAAAVRTPTRVQSLVNEFAPSRFTVVVLQDKDADSASLRCNFRSFEGYSMLNRSVNYFGEGYAFHQMVFARTEA